MGKNAAFGFFILAFFIINLVQGNTTASSLTERKPPVKPQHTQVTGAHILKDRIIIKFKEGTAVRLRGEQLHSLKSTDLATFQTLLNNYPGTTVHRLFSRSEQDLDQEKQDAERRSGWQLADLNLYYLLALNSSISAPEVETLVDALNALDVIEISYPDTIDTLPFADIPPTTPNFQPNQGYLSPSPQGVDALYAWGFPGGDGTGTKFIDVEYGWHLTHEDLQTPFFQTGTNNDSNDPVVYFISSYHGTAALGEVIGQRNDFGMTGIAPAAGFGVASPYLSNDYAAKINAAAAALNPGDVVLIELQTTGPSTGELCTCSCLVDPPNTTFLPEEWRQDVFDAIRTATAMGVIVVEPAANGSVNLDHAVYNGYFNRAVRDSGAIMVAASEVDTTLTHTGRASCFTNYGSRIDAHAWGNSVYTTGHDGSLFKGDTNPDLNQYYTLQFGGTSSASPIVAGSVLSTQGYMKQLKGAVLDPLAMRTLLAQTGTPQYFLESKLIGPLPDLRAAFQRLQTNPPPTISGFMPTAAYAGATIAISGTSLNGAIQVTFNGVLASFSVVSATQINATVPAGATTGYIKVTTPGGTATSLQIFTLGIPPTISSFIPTDGPVGAVVTITGTNFTVTTSVLFNGVAAQFTVVSDTQINATVPAGATTGKITVTTPDGTIASAGTFTVMRPPTITSFSPASGAVGTSVGINGSNFCYSNCSTRTGFQLTINGTPITPSTLFPGFMRVTIPAGATTGKFTVTTPAGTFTSADTFTVIPPPTITKFNQTSGKVGAEVSITGTNFCYLQCGTSTSTETTVKVNGVAATITWIQSGYLRFRIPVGATTGPITVTAPGGTATSATNLIVYQPPTITKLNQAGGKVGAEVSITGTNFCYLQCSTSTSTETQVKVNGVVATVTWIQSGYLRFRIPVGATSGPITVTAPGGAATSTQVLTVTP